MTVIVYSFVLPSSAATLTVIVFFPGFSDLVPVPYTTALSSAAEADTLILETSPFKLTVYCVFDAENFGLSVP